MFGVGVSIQIKKTKLLTEGQRRLALPVTDIARFLGTTIIARVRTGRGPRGPWKVYAMSEPAATDGKRRMFWVQPGRPQPEGDGFLFKPPTGDKVGWAAYKSARAYYTLRGLLGQPHRFVETDRLLKQAAVRIMNPRHARIAFYGSHGKLSAKQIAAIVSAPESDSILMPSAQEVAQVTRLARRRLNEAAIEAARAGATAQAIGSRAASLNRRLSKLLGD